MLSVGRLVRTAALAFLMAEAFRGGAMLLETFRYTFRLVEVLFCVRLVKKLTEYLRLAFLGRRSFKLEC